MRRRIALAAIGLVFLGASSAAWHFWPNPHWAAVKELRKELFSPAGRQLPAEDRRQKFEQLRKEMNMLTAAQRRGLRSEGMKRRTEQLNQYFALSKEEKTRYLDDLISRSEQRRMERQQNGFAPGSGGPFGGPPRGAGSGGPNRFDSAADRDKRRQDFLDSQPATARAEWTEFRKELNARRQQLGLPSGGRP